MTQDDIFKLIRQKEGLTPKEILDKLKLSRSSVSRELRALLKKKMIIYKKSNKTIRLYISK